MGLLGWFLLVVLLWVVFAVVFPVLFGAGEQFKETLDDPSSENNVKAFRAGVDATLPWYVELLEKFKKHPYAYIAVIVIAILLVRKFPGVF